MGYYVSLIDADFVIPAKNVEAALAALKRLNGPEYNDRKQPAPEQGDTPRYSWMSERWDEEETTLEGVLGRLNLETEVYRDGSVSIVLFDNKWRDHMALFVGTLAPFVPDGSHLTFSGEEPLDIWKWEVRDGTLVEYRAVIGWSDTHSLG